MIYLSTVGSNSCRLEAIAAKITPGSLSMPSLNPDRANLVAAAVSPEVPLSYRGISLLKGEWVQRPLNDAELKMIGVEFEGVMCSATKDDQDGVLAAFVGINSGLMTQTNVKFENGSRLVLNADNLAAFGAVWVPFRQSFGFAVV